MSTREVEPVRNRIDLSRRWPFDVETPFRQRQRVATSAAGGRQWLGYGQATGRARW
jgi:hypothetical protein